MNIFSKACLLASLALVMVPAQATVSWVIMPVGDSITEAEGSQNSFRRLLWQQLAEAGFGPDFTGSRDGNRDGPSRDQDFDTEHEGHWGWRADQFLANDRIDQWAADYQPDVLVVHLGTNDLRRGQSIDSTTNEVADIVSRVRSANPAVRVFIAQIIPTDTALVAQIEAFNAAVPALASSLETAESPVYVVDQFSGFDASLDTYDGIHPNDTGEAKMAAAWFASMSVALNQAPVLIDSIPNQSTEVGSEYSLELSGFVEDPEGHSFTFAARDLPTGLAVNANSGRISGTPTVAGNATVTVEVSDEFGGVLDASFSIDVAAPPPPPPPPSPPPPAPPPDPAPPADSGGGGGALSPWLFFLLAAGATRARRWRPRKSSAFFTVGQ